METSRAVGRALAVAALIVAVPVSAQNYSDSFSFLKAVKERDGGKVSELVSAPGSVVVNTKDRANGESALHYVVRDRDLTWVSYLLGKGARPDIQNKRGETPLSLAAQLDWLEGAELLLRMRASIDLPNAGGETPLILAVQRRNLAMVRALLNEGASAKRTDNTAGLSAIDYARRDGARSAAILKLLETHKPAANKAVAGPKI